MDLDVVGFIGAITAFILGLLKYKGDQKKKKLEIENLQLENKKLRIEQEELKFLKTEQHEKLSFYDDIIKLVIVNSIQDCVERIFKTTSADRILILTARNGKSSFKSADAIIDFYKNGYERLDAVRVYTNVELDPHYVKMLKDTEYYGFFDVETAKMASQILKHFYETEGVKHARMLPISRLPIDEDNDFLVYVSIAKHTDSEFTLAEKTIFNLNNNNGFKPNIQKLLKTAY
ncbi:hypothetical protein [Changchengzhania lutea]|uniref:hypothetical protein n=1 Tax=Changchengzhania lutea TaxID=2049305 RepID=UPI00115CEA86|nr:hypothetical protein [Changchengzhania lutea]